MGSLDAGRDDQATITEFGPTRTRADRVTPVASAPLTAQMRHTGRTRASSARDLTAAAATADWAPWRVRHPDLDIGTARHSLRLFVCIFERARPIGRPLAGETRRLDNEHDNAGHHSSDLLHTTRQPKVSVDRSKQTYRKL